jgi:hypothetical protein
MARITDSEYNTAEVGNIEKINGDYFTKVINADSNGDFVSPGKLVTVAFDEIQATYPTGDSEVYTYKNNSSTVATVTVQYSDTTKAVLTSVVRS